MEAATLEDVVKELRKLHSVMAAEQAELLDAHAVARLLSVSKPTLHRLASAGKLPVAVKIGGSVRWRKADLQAWITRGCA